MQYSENITRCEFLDEILSSQSDLRMIFRYLIGRVNMNPEIEMVLDFRNVDYISAYFVGQLMELRHHVNAGKGRLRLVEMNRQVFEILMVSRVNQCFDIDFKKNFGMQYVQFAHKVRKEIDPQQEGWAARLRAMITESNLFDFASHQKNAQIRKQLDKLDEQEQDQQRIAG
jgi:anti-anti-sigma factor